MTDKKNPVLPVLVRRRKPPFPEKNPVEEDEEEGVLERKRTMFYSQCLSSSKGPLGAIWVAGYFFSRLKKRQITDTDIKFAVDKILLEGLPSVNYRILAYLLLGVVRIYSRKVEFLFDDCHIAVSEVNRFSVGKKVVSFRDVVRSSPSIILPERYELDTFQLEVADCASNCNIARNEDITIQVSARKNVFSQYFLNTIIQNEDIITQGGGHGARKDVFSQCSLDNVARNEDICIQVGAEKDVLSQYSSDKIQFEEGSALWEDLCDDGVTMQQETCSSTQTPEKLTTERETSAHTPPDKVLSPHQMENNGANSLNYMKNFKTSKEKLRELRFTDEEGRDLEVDVELLNMINAYQAQTPVNMDEDALKKAPIENQEYVILKEKEVPSSTEKTHSEVANAEVTATPEFMVVPTPATKENIQRPCKRKCVFDETIMLDNEIMKRMIKEASGLVCKKRKVPHTVIDVWRFHRISALPNGFSEPLIPCVASEQEVICCGVERKRTKRSTSHPVEPIEITQAVEPIEITQAVEPIEITQAVEPIEKTQAVEPIVITQAPVKPQDAATSSAPTDSRSTIAPGTPVRCQNSARVVESFRGDSDGEGAQNVHSYENGMMELSVHEGAEDSCGPSLMAEMTENEGDSGELHKSKNGELPARTRTVARYLRRVIQRKKQQGAEAVTLLPIAENKTKRENALLFFEILALKTGGLINVVQEKPFGDVVLQETPELDEALKKC